MNNKKLSIFALLGIFFSGGLFASSEGVYGGVQYALVTIQGEAGLVEDAEPTALVARLGRNINANFALEARFGFGLADDSVTVTLPGFPAVDVDVDVDSLIGVYGVLSADLGNDNSFYGVLGFTDAEIEVSAGGLSADASESGLSFGLGVKLGSFTIEYMSYLDETDAEAEAVSFGFVANFD